MREHQPTFNVYQAVTDQLITLLERGTIPWRKPWASGGPPLNALTRRAYSGVNHWLLLALPYQSPLFLTFEQVQRAGGWVEKGEKGHLVVFWALRETPAPAPEEEDTTPTKERRTPLLRHYTVFNTEQCRGLPAHLTQSRREKPPLPVAACEGIVQGMPLAPPIRFGRDRAYYHPRKDYVNLPPMTRFSNSDGYYSTLFHELVHSTGHASRLGRKAVMEKEAFGSVRYSQEELVAELGSAYLCSYAGIGQREMRNQAAYIGGWLTHLRENARSLVLASAQAQRAVEFILNVQPEVTLLGSANGERA